jgi:hypothetical protein
MEMIIAHNKVDNSILSTESSTLAHQTHNNKISINYIDLFCGIGGFRLATEQLASELGIQVGHNP